MGFGILTDPYLGDDVPGTSRLHGSHICTPVIRNYNLKHSKDGILLVPQPSSSPDDPLNWSQWRKIMLMITLTFGVGVSGAWSSIISTGLPQVAISLHTSLDSLSKMSGDMTLSTALALIFTVPLIVVFGRRPVFLIGNALLLASTIWSAVSKDVDNLIASRVVGAMGIALTESFAETVIADVFFVHERARLLAIWGLALTCGSSGANIANGYLIQYISWRVCFVIEATLYTILLLFTIFFFPETAFVRNNVSFETETITAIEHKPEDRIDNVSEAEVVSKRSYWRSLNPWSGHRFSNETIWKITFRPFILLCNPIVAWATLLYGTALAWITALSISISILFSSPEAGYNLSSGAVGLIAGIGPLVGGVIGSVIAGPVSDWSVKWLSRRNGGIYEPEFRLLLIIPMLISTTIGWIGWAITSHFHVLWIGPAVFYSMLYFGLTVGCIGIFSYVVDAYGKHAPESFAMINLFKGVFSFAFSYVLVPWLNLQGSVITYRLGLDWIMDPR